MKEENEIIEMIRKIREQIISIKDLVDVAGEIGTNAALRYLMCAVEEYEMQLMDNIDLLLKLTEKK
jgi:hypothetical protein